MCITAASAAMPSVNLIKEARATLTQASGRPVSGWHSPGRSHSPNTLTLLAEQGFTYVTDWANDDMPYRVTTPAGRLCAMPLAYELSDRHLLVQHNLTVDDYVEQNLRAFDRLTLEVRSLRQRTRSFALGYALDSRLPASYRRLEAFAGPCPRRRVSLVRNRN